RPETFVIFLRLKCRKEIAVKNKVKLPATVLTSLGISTICCAIVSAEPLTWDSMRKMNQSGRSPRLPETELLLKNDQLFPGQSRSQAMALEAETGHLTPEEDAVLIPMLRRLQQTNIKANSIYLRRNHAFKSF